MAHPPHILAALGDFDLDPCSPMNRPWDTAKHHYTIEDDGLIQPWFGRVWCNPPYGKEMNPFLEKMVTHDPGGIVLIFARTETKAFFEYVWDKADAILFIKGRLKFYKPDGTEGDAAGSPSVLIAYGKKEAEVLRTCKIPGKFIDLSSSDKIDEGQELSTPDPQTDGTSIGGLKTTAFAER